MKEAFKARKMTDHVYWVGALDWDMRNFHGYLTARGTSYNAFLILADKITLVDAVKAPFESEMMGRIASVIDPASIDYVVSNHAELDHAGCLASVIEKVAPKKVFASPMGVKALNSHFHWDRDVTPVKTGESLSLGNMNLAFVETRMCHWPDSMVSYLDSDGVLFSQDAFGMHLASYKLYADQTDSAVTHHEAAKYYGNILLHLSNFVRRTLTTMGELDLNIKMIAPDHGPVWRQAEDIKWILDAYGRWADQKPTDKAVIVYDTMWQSTALMARAIGDGLAEGGARPELINMTCDHRSDLATELLDAGALIVGSPTLNNGIFPTIADGMCYMKGLKPLNLIGATFGSHGWSGEAPKLLAQMLTDMKVDLVADPLRVNYVPDGEALTQCRQLGLDIAKRLTEAT